MFRQQVGNLQLIVGIYNNVQATILPVEKPLITQKLEAVDSALKKGLQVNYILQSLKVRQISVLFCNCANICLIHHPWPLSASLLIQACQQRNAR